MLKKHWKDSPCRPGHDPGSRAKSPGFQIKSGMTINLN